MFSAAFKPSVPALFFFFFLVYNTQDLSVRGFYKLPCEGWQNHGFIFFLMDIYKAGGCFPPNCNAV